VLAFTRRGTPALQLLDWQESSGSAQEPRHASNQTDDSKSRNNPKMDQLATGLFDELASPIPSRGTKKGTIGFGLSHGSSAAIDHNQREHQRYAEDD